MSFWTPPNGANPHSYSFASPLGNLRKPPVNNNPISQVKARPVKATVQGIQQAKQASEKKADVAGSGTGATADSMGIPKNLWYGGSSEPMNLPFGASSVGDMLPALFSRSLPDDKNPYMLPGKQKFPTSPAPHVVRELASIFPEKYPLSSQASPPSQVSPQSPADFSGLGALGGAGLGGALGYMMGGSDDEEKGRDNSTNRMMGTLGGAGLGGGLGYLAGNPGIRLSLLSALGMGKAASAKSASSDRTLVKKAILGLMTKKARCWKGYEPVPGKKPYSDDSCRPVGSKKKKPEGKTEKKAADQFRKAITVVLAKKLVG